MKTILYKGTRIKGKNGGLYVVESLINHSTGQGDVYKIKNDRKEVFALKLFHSGDRKKNLLQIERLIRRGQACEAFVTPIEIVECEGRVGYVMEYVGKEYDSAAVLFNGVEENGRIVELGWTEKLAFLGQIAESFLVLNRAGLGVMDIKFDNILVNLADRSIKILDTDTIVYKGDEPMVLGTVGFMPPDTQTRREEPNEYNDAYAIAVLIFMALLGAHPLDGKRRNQPCNENIDAYLFGTHPVYLFHPSDTSNRPIPRDGYGMNQQRTIDKFKRYPKYFKDAMQKTFVAGLHDGKKRTTIEEWCEILERLYGDSFICETCGEEFFFHNADKVCPVCKQPVVKPVFLQSEDGKSVALFNGLTIFSTDLFFTTGQYDLFRVAETVYDGRFGLENLQSEPVLLKLPNGTVRQYRQGEAIPIFLDSEIVAENKTLRFV